MDRLYQEICQELENGIRLFADEKIEYNELLEIGQKEKLFWIDWSEEEKRLRREIYEKLLNLYKETVYLEKITNELSDSNKDKIVDVDFEYLISHAALLGRNKIPQSNAENSQWFLPPYPEPEMPSNIDNEKN